MSFIGDLVLTGIFGAGIGAGLLKLASLLRLEVLHTPAQGPVFVIGTLAFALVFRFWMMVKEEKSG